MNADKEDIVCMGRSECSRVNGYSDIGRKLLERAEMEGKVINLKDG